jgi:hypothetical protein
MMVVGAYCSRHKLKMCVGSMLRSWFKFYWNDIYSRKLIETLQDHGLQQHVIGSTHVRGHTLDVVITRENSVILSSILKEQNLINH